MCRAERPLPDESIGCPHTRASPMQQMGSRVDGFSAFRQIITHQENIKRTAPASECARTRSASARETATRPALAAMEAKTWVRRQESMAKVQSMVLAVPESVQRAPERT
eukprot:jgi/Antlo1/1177/1083